MSATAPRATISRPCNPDRRDELLGTRGGHYSAGIKPFTDLDVARLETLLAEGFIDPEGRQNASPSTREFLRFMQRWPTSRAHGYAVSRRRVDCRVTLDRLVCDLRSLDDASAARARSEFELFCRGADEYRDDNSVLEAFWD